MQTTGYLSTLMLDQYDPSIFRIALVAYDDLLVDIPIDNMDWMLYFPMKDRGKKWSKKEWDQFREYRKSAKPLVKAEEIETNPEIEKIFVNPEEVKGKFKTYSLGTSSVEEIFQGGFMRYFDYSPDLMKQIRNKLVSTSTYKGGVIKGSLDGSIRHPRSKNGGSLYKSMLFDWLNIYLSSPEWAEVADEITPHPLFYSPSSTNDNFASHISKKMILKCFCEDYFASDYLLKKSIASPILSATHIALRNIIRSTVPIIPSWRNAKEEKIVYRFLKTIHKIEKTENASMRHESLVPLLELSVPKFDNIPMPEIISLKAKDKFSSLGKLLEDSGLASPTINNLDTAKIFIDQLWAMGKQLSPSIPEATIGVLSNLPVPFISMPLGILSSMNEIKGLISFKKDYSWFIVLSQLRELSKNANKDKT